MFYFFIVKRVFASDAHYLHYLSDRLADLLSFSRHVVQTVLHVITILVGFVVVAVMVIAPTNFFLICDGCILTRSTKDSNTTLDLHGLSLRLYELYSPNGVQ